MEHERSTIIPLKKGDFENNSPPLTTGVGGDLNLCIRKKDPPLSPLKKGDFEFN